MTADSLGGSLFFQFSGFLLFMICGRAALGRILWAMRSS